MVVIKRIVKVLLLIGILWTVLKGSIEDGREMVEAKEKREERLTAQKEMKVNVIEEMLEAGDTLWEEAELIQVGGCDAWRLTYVFPEHPHLQIGLIYSSQYRRLYFYGEVIGRELKEEENDQEQFETCLEEEGISWSQVEDYKEDFLCGQIFDPWFSGGEGIYTRDELGDLQVIDLLMPYTYCGVEYSSEAKVEVVYEDGYDGLFPHKITTITYTAPKGTTSIQTYWEYYYQNTLERIEADMLGQRVIDERFKIVTKEGEEYRAWLERVLKEEDGNGWDTLLYEGKFIGSMTKLAYRREDGEAATRQWLGEENYEFYYHEVARSMEVFFDQDYVYVRVPVYDWNSEELEWVMNGTGQQWKVWLAFAWEDLDKSDNDD